MYCNITIEYIAIYFYKYKCKCIFLYILQYIAYIFKLKKPTIDIFMRHSCLTFGIC